MTRPLPERPSGRHDAQNPVASTECHNGKRYIHADTLLNWSVSYKRLRLVHGTRSDDENVEQSHQTRESESITGWYRSIRSYQSAGRVDDYSVRNEVALTKPSDCVCSHRKAHESAGALIGASLRADSEGSIGGTLGGRGFAQKRCQLLVKCDGNCSAMPVKIW